MPNDDPTMAVPAFYASRYAIHVTPAVARVAFGEQLHDDAEPLFHSAVVLRTDDALTLAKMLIAAVAEVRHKEAASRAREGSTLQ